MSFVSERLKGTTSDVRMPLIDVSGVQNDFGIGIRLDKLRDEECAWEIRHSLQ